MVRDASPTDAESDGAFVCEIPLRVTPEQRRELLIRLECARQVYNACLGEGLRRLRLARESKAWGTARDQPKGSKEKREAFAAIRNRFGLSLYSLISPAKHLITAAWKGTQQFTRTWIGEHLDSACVQVIAARAWAAIDRYQVRTGGRPRFKRAGQMASIEAKAPKNPLRWDGGVVIWKGLRLSPDGDLAQGARREVAHGLAAVAAGHLRYVRLVHRRIQDVDRFFAQLVLRGSPLERCVRGTGSVGIDLGPSTIAWTSESASGLEQLAPGVVAGYAERRRTQRALDRSRRRTNPDAFDAAGRYKPGRRITVTSRRYRSLQQRLADIDRRMAATRKSEHGALANRLIGLGDTIKLERLSYVAFQKCFGRSVGVRAPGLLVSTITRKAASAGVSVVEIDPWRTRLSQTCICGVIAKKALSERVHRCVACGATMQRDLLSAFLAAHVADDGISLQADQARVAWSGPRSMALRAAWRASSIGDGVDHLVGPHVPPPGGTESRSLAHVPSITGEASDAVVEAQAIHESRGELVGYGTSAHIGATAWSS